LSMKGTGPEGEWELYDMESDRAEMHDLSAEHPERVEQLMREWEEWATRVKVKPWPWDK
jgi:arylsulfatase A-like enzyme